MTLNGVMAVILRYFSEFGYLPVVLRKSPLSLSHLLMSSCFESANSFGRHSDVCICLVEHVMWQYCELLELLDIGTRQSSACPKQKNNMQILAKSQVTVNFLQCFDLSSVLWHCWFGVRKSIRPVKMKWWGAGVVIHLDECANDLHMVKLMRLPPHYLLLH